MKKTRQVSFKITGSLAGSLAQVGKNVNWTANRATDSWYYLKKATLLELKNKFAKNELKGIIARMNGLIFEPKMSVSVEILKAGMSDACELDHIDEQFEFSAEELIAKIGTLTSAQAFFLAEWADCFWTANKKKDLDAYIEELLS